MRRYKFNFYAGKETPTCYLCGEEAIDRCDECGKWVCVRHLHIWIYDPNGSEAVCTACVGPYERRKIDEWLNAHATGGRR